MSMETGGVENPGAINSRDDDASVSSNPELMDAPIEDNGINFDAVTDSNMATNEEKDYSFSSKDISKHKKTEFFTNVEGAEKRAKKAERDKLKQERRSRKKILREASETKKNELRERNQNEAKKNREVKRIREAYRIEKFRGFIWRYKALIILVVTTVTLTTLAVIFVPKIIDGVGRAHKEQLVAENKTDMMKVFIEIAGKEYEKTEFDNVVKGISDKLMISYYAEAGVITAEDSEDEIGFNTAEENDKTMVSSFGFSGQESDKFIEIVPSEEGFSYYEERQEKYSGTIDDMINKLILKRSGASDD